MKDIERLLTVSALDRGRIAVYRFAKYSSKKSVNVLDETKQLSCGSVIAGSRRKRRIDRTDRTHLAAPLLVMTGGLCAWQ
ncbi:hypothetical protein TNCV_4168611 [Trichonephila clavipes]|nr:hypothetical protein TNCV_4168611 [Trichonephila clavipes]